MAQAFVEGGKNEARILEVKVDMSRCRWQK
jgi:hypothetical protein